MDIVKIGDRATDKRRFNALDVKNYAELTGDFNPIHFDAEYARNTFFKKPIVHGPFVITLLTTLFAKELPGPGSVYMSHDVKYISPVFVGEEITAILEVIDITLKNHIILKTICLNEKDEVVITGIARLKKF